VFRVYAGMALINLPFQKKKERWYSRNSRTIRKRIFTKNDSPDVVGWRCSGLWSLHYQE